MIEQTVSHICRKLTLGDVVWTEEVFCGDEVIGVVDFDTSVGSGFDSGFDSVLDSDFDA